MDSKQILESPQEKPSSAKKGGPYTEQQKLERQNKVYHLHFEKGYSAVRIAEELGVNRNTINSDIKEWYLQLADELPEHEVASLLLSQLHALRAQKARLVDSLEKLTDQKNRIPYEKLICDIDWKISQLVVKLMIAKYPASTVYIKQKLTNEKNGKLPYGYLK
jgi:predicted DNA-binding protein YlxM (UPF0122 family)